MARLRSQLSLREVRTLGPPRPNCNKWKGVRKPESATVVLPSLTLLCPGGAAAHPEEPRPSAIGTRIPPPDRGGNTTALDPASAFLPSQLRPCLSPRTTLRPRLPAPGHTMTEQFEWTKGRLGSLTYLVEPALGWKNGNVAVKTSAGTTGHVGAPTTSSTVSEPRSSRTRRTNPPGSCNDCFRGIGWLHPLLRAELSTLASVQARRELRGPTPHWGWGEQGRPSVCACASPTAGRTSEVGLR